MRDQSFQFRVVANTVLGGLGSVAAGGNFGNGALMAAFGYLFNEVALVCRGVGFSGNPIQHCGLFVFDRPGEGLTLRSAEIRAQFSLGNTDTEFNRTWFSYFNDRLAFYEENNVHTIQPPKGMSQEEFEATIMKNGEKYRAGSYSIGGPNSNSAAEWVIINSGGQVPSLLRAPAIDYWRRNLYP